MSERVHEIEFFRGAAADDVAVFTSIASQPGPALVVARTARDGGHARLLDEALATARRAELRHQLAGLPFAAAALLVHATDAAAHRSLMARLGGGLDDRGLRFVADAGVGAGDLALLRASPGEATEVGDLARWTALGVFASIERVLERRLGKPLAQASVVVQGLGSVGMALCELLDAAGAVLMVADPRRERVRQASLLFNALPLAPERVLTTSADVFAPCAPDCALDVEAAARLNVGLVAGAADGQLANADAAEILHDRGVLCAPDFVVNAGAAIASAAPRLRLDRPAVERRVRAVADTLDRVLDRAQALRVPPLAGAHEMARRGATAPAEATARAYA